MVKLAPSTSLRPKSRPVKNQTEEMLRPKSREDAKQEQEKRQLQMKQFGYLEYRAELEPQLSLNPIARLGYDPEAHGVLKPTAPNKGLAFSGGGPKTAERLLELGFLPQDAKKAKKPKSIITTSNFSFPPVISHEFTHRGFELLR